MRNKFERFCFRNRDVGIPNLMLFVVIGNALAYVLATTNPNPEFLYYLYFDKDLILQGQVWRLVTHIFLDFQSNIVLMILSMYVYYSVGRHIEQVWGTLRFNLFFFSSILLTDIFCMLTYNSSVLNFTLALPMARYIHMSLFMAYATMHLDAGFVLFFLIPIRGWMLVLIDLGFTIYDILQMCRYGFAPFYLYPLIPLVNYALFFGKDVLNVLPLSFRARFKRTTPSKTAAKTIPFSGGSTQQPRVAKAAYTHKCTVCGRTDISDPQLEFRYCSRCSGYHCYCGDHISNHTHIV